MDEFEARAGLWPPNIKCCKKGILLSWRSPAGRFDGVFHFCFRAECGGLRLRAAPCEPRPAALLQTGTPPLCAPSVRRGVFRWMRRCSRRLKTRARSGAGRNGTLFLHGWHRRTARRSQRRTPAPTMPKRCCSIWPAAARPAEPRASRLCAGPYNAPALLWAQRLDVLAYLATAALRAVTDAAMTERIRPQPHPPRRAARSGARAHQRRAQRITRFAAEMSAVADYLEEQAGALLEQACVPRAVYLPGNIPDAYGAQTLAAAPAAAAYGAGPAHRGPQRRSRK